MTTYVNINPDNQATRQDALVVIGAKPKKIIDTTGSATLNIICVNLRDSAVDTDSDWQIYAWPKTSPFIMKWAVDSVTNKPTSAFQFKASSRLNLNFG